MRAPDRQRAGPIRAGVVLQPASYGGRITRVFQRAARGHKTEAVRDYNNDGVCDCDGNLFSLPKVEDLNLLLGRGPRYADTALDAEGCPD